MMETLGIWIGAFGTLAIISFLYRENPVFRTAEHLFIGLAAGIGIFYGFETIKTNAWNPLFNPAAGDARQWFMIVPLILGVLLYSRFTTNFKWVSRIPLGFIVGVGSALAIRGVIGASFMSQILATMRLPLWGTMVKFSFDSLLFVLGVLGTLIYFYFSREQTGPLKYGASVGKWVMMIAFGAAFGNTVMARMSLLVGRIYFLMSEWLQLL
jgi:hypothetical protein